MATAWKESDSRICDTCTPKRTVAITSCHGCNQHFCRQHFNTHRDQLSKCLNNHINLHNEIAQDLKTRINRSLHDQLNNDEARRLLHQIDQWKTRTIDECRQVATKARNSLRELFDKTKENDAFSQRLLTIANELEEQQRVENFIESDLDRWMRQLKELQKSINQPIEFLHGINIEIQDVDLSESIHICPPSNPEQTIKHYVLVAGEKGVGKTTFIHYVTNYFAGKYTFVDRLALKTIELNKKQSFIKSHHSEEKYVVNQYSFPIADQTVLVFLDLSECHVDENEMTSVSDLFGITQFAGIIGILDSTDTADSTDWRDVKPEDLLEALEEIQEVRNFCRQLSMIFVNSSTHTLDANYHRSINYHNTSFHFMQNSAYQLYRSRTLTDSAEMDYHRSMRTIEKIIKRIIKGIQQPK